MSDYVFILESHLGTDQNRVVTEIQAAAGEANASIFLTGGAMRDMLGGFPIRDLDFTVESPNALKIAKAVAKKTGARVEEDDELRKCVELVFPGGVTASVAMARGETYPKPGGKPVVSPATIHEDLRRRDFTVNAIALSLNRASRGLLIDPTNGLGDLEHKELRTCYNYAFYDDPARLLRLVRLRVRLGFTVEERTRQQFDNTHAERLEEKIPPRRLLEELRSTAAEPNAAEVLRALEEEGLLGLFSPALTGAKLNLHGLAKLQKSRQLVPFGVQFPLVNFGLLLYTLTEKLTPKEKAGLIKATGMRRADVDAWQKLEARSRKLERELKSPRLNRPSQVHEALVKAPGDEVLFLLTRSPLRLVQDRIRNYLQKYLPAAQEVTDEDVRQERGVEPGTPKFAKTKQEVIAARLNARPKKVAPEAEEAKPAEPSAPPGALRKPLTRQPSAR
jgi:tRNA nucleotidyltransferase (CCA-adding enzyme)